MSNDNVVSLTAPARERIQPRTFFGPTGHGYESRCNASLSITAR